MSFTKLLSPENSLLVVIDLQGKLMDMVYRPQLVKQATIRLMQLAEIFEVPVILTEQYPKGLGTTHEDVRQAFDGLSVPTRFVEKLAFGCCGDSGFEQAVDELRPGLPDSELQLVVAGIETHVCVMQTVLPSLEMGRQVHVCWEAVSGRGEEYRRHGLERMQQAGAVITNHESVCFEWARTKEHPQFKAMNQILREGQLH
ncbi:isochorismatase family protein [bacterium]|nr:isochorismatase family protein [bacterium]UNM08526.1 MAG: isochorismatase family protein [Planctomycetales bacterium]